MKTLSHGLSNWQLTYRCFAIEGIMRSHWHREKRSFRAWLYYSERRCVIIECAWLCTFCHATFNFDDEHGWGGSLALPPVAFWLHIGVPRWLQLQRDREIKFSIHGWALYWTIWRDWKEGWSRDVPRWRDGAFNFLDFVFGRPTCTHFDKEVRKIIVPMPEKSYPATARLQQWTWKRPRWFAKTINRVEIDIPDGIPFPGKGESEYDCGDDATYGVTTGECNSIPEAVGNLVASTLQRRVRYGGWSDYTWKRES